MSYPRLYNLTLRIGDAVGSVAICSNDKYEEVIIVAKNQYIEALSVIDDELKVLARVNTFSVVRSLASANNSSSFYISTDAGQVIVMEFDAVKSTFVTIGSHSLGLNGLRRNALGEYLAVDENSRALFIGAIEKNRAVLPVNMETAQLDQELVPANRPLTVCYDMQSFSNSETAGFYCLEKIKYGVIKLACYEFNIGLNLVVKVWDCDVNKDANFIETVNQSVLVFSDTCIELVVSGKILDSCAGTVVCAKYVRTGFVIAQLRNNDWVIVRIIDSKLTLTPFLLPSNRARTLCVLKAGYIIIFPETGDLSVNQITSLDPFEAENIYCSTSLAPVLSSSCWDHELVCTTGSRPESRFITYNPGLPCAEMADTPLPQKAIDVFCCQKSVKDSGHTLIVLSFETSTTTLAVTEDGSVEEVNEAVTMLAESVRTLGASFIGSGVCQVHSRGFRHVVNNQIVSWTAPNRASIDMCAFSPSQLAVALNSGYVVYFEARENGLVESQQRIQVMASSITFKQVPNTELKSPELFVGSGKSVKVYSTASLNQSKLLAFNQPVCSVLVNAGYTYTGHPNGSVTVIKDNEQQTIYPGKGEVKLIRFKDSVLAVSKRIMLLNGFTARPIEHSFHSCAQFITSDTDTTLAAVSSTGLHIMDVDLSLNNVTGTLNLIEPEVNETVLTHLKLGNGIRVVLTNSRIIMDDETTELDGICTGAVIKLNGLEYLAVATTPSQPALHLFKPQPKLELVHTTALDAEVHLISSFKEMVLVCFKSEVTLYGLGMKQLLKKSSIKLETSSIKSEVHSGNVMFIGDSQTSVHVLEFTENRLKEVASDFVPRGAQCMVLLDAATVCIGDRNGNINVLRHNFDDPGKLELVNAFCVKDSITSLLKGNISSKISQFQSILYTCVSGAVGALYPLPSQEEYAVLKSIETALLKSMPGHQAFRTGLAPPLNVVDGDLCELVLQKSCNELDSMIDDVEMSSQQVQYRVGSIRCLM